MIFPLLMDKNILETDFEAKLREIRA